MAKDDHPLHESFSSLGTAMQSSNRIVAGIAATAMLIVVLVSSIALLSNALFTGIIILLVLFTSLVVYFRTSDYGDAAIALVAGLLTAFTVEWTVSQFVAFIAIWGGFSLIALLISSAKVAGSLKTIYLQAAGSLASDPREIQRTAKELQAIGNKPTPYKQLQAIQRAEAVRLLAFRKLPTDSYVNALAAIETFAVVSGSDVKTVTLFVADVVKVLMQYQPDEASQMLEGILSTVRESAVPPEDFVQAFSRSRRILLSGAMDPIQYFREVRQYLENGVAPEDMLQALRLGD